MRFLTLVSAALLAALTSLAIPAQAAEKVTIAAAADLKFAMDEIVGAFRKAHPGAELDVIYGSSGKIHTQIQQGAPFDLFFSADVGFARELRSAGQAVTDPKLYTIGRIICPDRQLDGSALHSFRPLTAVSRRMAGASRNGVGSSKPNSATHDLSPAAIQEDRGRAQAPQRRSDNKAARQGSHLTPCSSPRGRPCASR